MNDENSGLTDEIVLPKKLFLIYEYIAGHPGCGKQQLMGYTGYGYQGITNVIKELKKRGTITATSMHGADARAMSYSVSDREIYGLVNKVVCSHCHHSWLPVKKNVGKCHRCGKKTVHTSKTPEGKVVNGG